MGAFPKLEEGACISGWVLNCSAVWLSIYYHFSALRKSTLQTSLKPVLSVLLSGMLIIAESNSCTAAFFFCTLHFIFVEIFWLCHSCCLL